MYIFLDYMFLGFEIYLCHISLKIAVNLTVISYFDQSSCCKGSSHSYWKVKVELYL